VPRAHAEQHRIGEIAFEKRHGLDLVALAQEFARRSPHWSKLRNIMEGEAWTETRHTPERTEA
jgi:hypothetical protein